MNRRPLSKIQKMSFAAMLLALSAVFTVISKAVSIPGVRFATISLAPSVTMFASIILGPFYGLLVGVGGDLIGLAYNTGVYNFFYTIIAGLYGVLPYLLLFLTKHFRKSLKAPYFIYAMLGIILIILVCFMYGTDIFDQDNAMGDKAYWLKPLCLSLCFVLEVGLVVGLYFTNRYFNKDDSISEEIPSPNEIALICLFVEILLGVFGRAGGLSYYFNVLADAGATFINTSYPFLILFLLVMAPFNIIIDTFIMSWLTIYFEKFSASRGYCLKEEKDPVPEIDTSELTEEEKKQLKISFPYGLAIFIGVIAILIIVCIVVIKSI